MSQEEPVEQAKSGCRSMGCLLGGGGLAFFLLLIMSGFGVGLIDLGGNLLFGWIAFISRVLPKISWDWGAIGTSIVFAGLVAIVAHRFLVWLTGGIAAARGRLFQWQWKWTVCGLLLLGFCLLVGMAVTGTAHQVGWVLGSKESWYEDRYSMRGYIEARNVEQAIMHVLPEANTLPDLRKKVPALLGEMVRVSPLESVRVLVSLSPANTVNGVLIIPLDKRVQTRFGARYVTTNDDSSPIAFKDLPGFIQSHASNLVAF